MHFFTISLFLGGIVHIAWDILRLLLKQKRHIGIVSDNGLYISADDFKVVEKPYYNRNTAIYEGKYSDRVFSRPIKK